MAYIYWFASHSWGLYQTTAKRLLDSLLARRSRVSTPSHAHTVRIHNIVSRHIPDDNDFLAPYRTTFLWECTGRHVPDESFEHMVKGLLTLYWHIHRCFKENIQIDASLFTLISLLSEGMFRKEVERPGGVTAQSLTSGYYVNVLGLFSRLATIDGPSKLPAQLCLANTRWSFLKLYLNTPRRSLTAAPLYEEQVHGYFDNTFNGQFTLNGRHPSALLVLLVLGHYSLALNSWLCRAESVLVPLHADVCCTSWQHALAPENVAHLAACNALTMVSQVLNALSTNDERDSALLRNAPNSILVDIDKTFPMPGCGRRVPSPEFVSILRASGLEEWLEPDSDYSTEPRDGPFYKYRYYLYVNDCVSILRTLALSVDMTALHLPSLGQLAVLPAHDIGAIGNPYYMASQISPTSSSLTEWSTPDDLGKKGQDEIATVDDATSLSAVVIDDHRDISRARGRHTF
ncbi:hypothetical protein PENSPDRAFT_63594 [Peniophora sp. CONT]|nr:hypothetical protein PENSPDRAFT_63594 [Peniophora sp. CONT]